MKTIALPLDHEPSYEDNSNYGKLSLLYSTLTRLTDAICEPLVLVLLVLASQTSSLHSLIFVNTIDLQRATE